MKERHQNGIILERSLVMKTVKDDWSRQANLGQNSQVMTPIVPWKLAWTTKASGDRRALHTACAAKTFSGWTNGWMYS